MFHSDKTYTDMKAKYLLSFVILCSLLLSCKDDRPFEDAYLWQNNASLTASLTTLLFEADASTQTVAINTNSGYGITVDQTWLTVERAADNQTLTVSVQANTTSTTRNATVTINASGKSQTISVSQSASSLKVSESTLAFEASESSQTVSVTASGNYTYSTDASWLTITKGSATTRAESVTELTITAVANTEESERTATITLTLGSITKTIEVTQEGANTRTFTITGNGKTVTFKMKKVQGGTFQMGSTSGDSDAQPVHSVTISKAYYMCETEVTQALWYAVMGQSPTSDGKQWSSTDGMGDNYPAYWISYEDCQSFLSALNSKLSSQLVSGEQFRFPTEAEWEFAAKGGKKSQGYTYSGSNTIGDVAWYEDNSGDKAHQVKTKSPNELGLYDMSGNVWEWCYDWYGSYSSSSSAQTDPAGSATGSQRVNRGGGWSHDYSYCRVANRVMNAPLNRYKTLGFRLCLGSPISEPVPSLSVSPTSLSFDASASSSKTVNVTANGDYTYSTSASWLTITQSSDKTTLTVSASANTGTSERTATITLTLGSLTKTVSVTQEAAQQPISDEERTFTVTGHGKTVTFKMIKVEGGTFQMGRAGSENVQTPIHSVTITNDYYLCESEVTQALWYAVMGQSPTSSGNQWSSTYGIGDSCPAYYLSYEDCQSFLIALNNRLSSQLGVGEQFRFPTEAEWEFAAKGGKYSNGYPYSGSNTIDDVAWYSSNTTTPHPVKTKKANELGLYDMSGNGAEWCYDWYGDYSSSAQTDPTGPTSGSERVYRGGIWFYNATNCIVAKRNKLIPTYRYYGLGFRLCLGAPIE